MCGITGIYSLTGTPMQAESILRRMLSRIQYRGPDESGIYLNGNVALGSVRLSIIDIRSGQQPFSTADGKYWIVFNGEIFNYIELKASLRQMGFQFRTESDTEVLLYTYLAYGAACLDKLNGQFVFALWSSEKNELFLARDRVGIRPLFYTWTDNQFVFGSEIKTLFEHPDIKAEFDPVALAQVFTFWTTITPGTFFRNILELPPGHYLRINGRDAKPEKFWSLRFPRAPEEYFRGTLQDAQDELKSVLTDAVRIRLRADVPVAAYLSGGLDSSATTALIQEVAPETLQTFSIGFEDAEFDETVFQQAVSHKLQTRHTAFTCSRQDIGNFFPRVVWHAEIPILRTAPVPMYCLSKKVRENNIKVVITGEGADEMLAGYDIFKEGIIREFWSRQPDSKYRPMLFEKLYPYLAQFKGKNKSILRVFFGYQLQHTGSPFYSHLLRWKNTSALQNLFSENLKHQLSGYEPLETIAGLLPAGFDRYDLLGKSQWLETMLFMSGYLLSSQGDRVAMANSVEGRYPFLDYRVMEFAATLPSDYKMHGLNEKFILKKMMQDRLPEIVLKRPKQAYRAPIAQSFLSSPAREYVMDLLAERDIQQAGFFSYDAVRKLLEKTTRADMVTEIDNMALAGLISTQLLYHQYILRDNFRPPVSALENCRVVREPNTICT